ncbi:hypothetical protein HaLaN_01551, partial [Haematococcus lacustris]
RVGLVTPPIEPPTPLTIRDNGFSGLISARVYTRIEASECGRAEARAELVGHVAGWRHAYHPAPYSSSERGGLPKLQHVAAPLTPPPPPHCCSCVLVSLANSLALHALCAHAPIAWLILADRVGKCNALGFVQHCNAYHKPAAAADPSKAHRARASVGHRWCLELSTREVELCSAPQRDAHAFASSIPGSMSMHSCFFPAAWIHVEWSETACACAQCMTPAPRGVCMRPTITKPFVAMPMFDQKRDDKHWDDEFLTLLCSFAPDSVMQLCTLGKKLSVKMLNEYCKAVGLYVPAITLRADLRGELCIPRCGCCQAAFKRPIAQSGTVRVPGRLPVTVGASSSGEQAQARRKDKAFRVKMTTQLSPGTPQSQMSLTWWFNGRGDRLPRACSSTDAWPLRATVSGRRFQQDD